ncbi:MAG: SRPBCC family protein [Micromonosporaceae bacterium]
MAEPTAQSSIDIAAPPALVYELVSNVPEMPRWAAENDRCVWIGGADGAVIGARFRGRNQHRGRRWATICEVTEADPSRRFGFKVRVANLPSALWRYDIEPSDSGCRVTESTRRLTPRLLARVVNRVLFGIRDRDVHNQRNIERTLAQLKEYAEAAAADKPA